MFVNESRLCKLADCRGVCVCVWACVCYDYKYKYSAVCGRIPVPHCDTWHMFLVIAVTSLFHYQCIIDTGSRSMFLSINEIA